MGHIMTGQNTQIHAGTTSQTCTKSAFAKMTRSWWMLFSLIALFGLSAISVASGPIFSITKNICAGVPTTIPDPESCELATQVGMNQPVYYVITITSPWGQPQQQVDLIDEYKPEFTPTAGALYCTDDLTGNVVPYLPSAQSNGIASVTLNMGQTIHCFVPGTFNAAGNSENTVEGKNNDKYDASSDVETNVLNTTPLGADLSVTKAVDKTGIDISNGGSDTLTYTITIKNNGPADVNVGNFFKLYDKLSLLPNGVPLNVEFDSASCITNVNAANASKPDQTDCLDGAGPTLYGPQPTFVGTMAPTNFFNWAFATGDNGHINAGDSIILTITVKVSALKDLNCIAKLKSDGIRNTTFFNLTNAAQGTAYSEINNLNNTASVDTDVTTGQTDIIPDCGRGHLRVTKKQIEPTTNPVAWNTPVTYEITIENASLPNQPITIKKPDLKDWLTQGINTPRFTANHLGTICATATSSTLCAAFNANSPTVNDQTPLSFNYYGHTQVAWESVDDLTLNFGEKIVLHTTFSYDKPDCETVPNTPLRPIFNTARVTYKATPYGGKLLPPSVTFTQEGTAETDMEKVKACAFKVTKSVKNPNGSRLQFGVPFDYILTFTNNGAPRDVGTLMDSVRIDVAGYTSSLPFSTNFTCTQTGGVSGYNSNGGIAAGYAVNTTTPAQGSPAANFGSNINFPTGSTLTCIVTTTVNRPAFNDQFCTTKPAKFENMALMDVTNPFNNNIFWPPSSTYTNGAYSNPPVQAFNWATASLDLPPCWDVNINKSAKVAGLPSTNSPWTYSGNANAINYTITTTNTAQGSLGNSGSPNPGWTVTDGFVDASNPAIPSAYYNNANVSQGHTAPPAQVCVLPGWCWTIPPHNGTSQIGIKNLNPGENGIWNIQFNGNPVTGQDISNCAKVDIGGKQSGVYYSNFDPAVPKQDCVKIPVVEVTKIPVQKIVDDQTGAGIKAAGPFGFTASCNPFPLQTVSTTFSLSTNATGTSPIHNIFPVPVLSSSCTITEVSKPAAPQAAVNACIAKLGQGASAVWQTAGSPTTLTGPFSQNMATVKITNSLVCVPPKKVPLNVTKIVTNPTLPNGQNGGIITLPTFPISISCNPAATPNNLPLLNGSTGTVSVLPGSICTVSEPNPPIPSLVSEYCRGKGLQAQWVTKYSPNNPFTVGPNGTDVEVTNTWECVPDKESAQVIVTKTLKGPFNLPRDQLSLLTFTVTANCTPAAVPNTVTVSPGQSAVFNVKLGAICTYTETLPQMPKEFMDYCKKRGGFAHWKTPKFLPAATGYIKNKKEKLEVVNEWHCIDKYPNGMVNIMKRVDSGDLPPGTNIPLQNYTIGVSCNKPTSSNTVVIQAGTTTGLGYFTTEIGASCTLSEATPPMPNVITQYCKSKGFTGATWNPPSFTPSATIAPVAANQTVVIGNSWKCNGTPPKDTKIEIIKKLEGPQISSTFPAMIFNIKANCSPAATPITVPITTPATSTMPVTASGSTQVQMGASCVISEPSLPVLPVEARNHCVALLGAGAYASWENPSYSPSSNIVASSAVQTVTVTNKWKCNAPFIHPWLLKVEKIVLGPVGAPALPPAPYVFNTNCSVPTTPTSLTVTTATTQFNTIAVQTGASCSVSETPPAVPQAASNYCSSVIQGQIAVWDTPIISPAGPVAGSFPSDPKTVTVTNRWKCVSLAKKKKPRFKINIGIGGSIGGGGRDKPREQPRDTPRPNGP